MVAVGNVHGNINNNNRKKNFFQHEMEGWNIAQFKFQHLPETELRKEWLRWKRNFEVVAAASEEENATKLKNVLLAKGGLELQDLFYSLEGADVKEDKENGIDPYKTAIQKLDQHFTPKQHDSFERNEFCKLAPLKFADNEREPLVKFLMRCTDQAKKCEFGNTQAESRDLRIIDKIIYHAPVELREKLLQEETLTLEKVTRMVNSFESIKHQAQVITETGTGTGGPTRYGSLDSREAVNRIQGTAKSSSVTGICFRCGQKNHYGNDLRCPARGKKCDQCNKMGHFAKVCRSTMKRKHPENRMANNMFDAQAKRRKMDNVRAIAATEDSADQPSFIYNIGDGDELLWVKIGGVLVQVFVNYYMMGRFWQWSRLYSFIQSGSHRLRKQQKHHRRQNVEIYA